VEQAAHRNLKGAARPIRSNPEEEAAARRDPKGGAHRTR